jgi:NADH:ubiquinone oxidoreductase subunit C
MLHLYKKLKNNFKIINTSLLKGIYINNFEINLFVNSNALYFILKILKKKTQFQLSSLIDIFVYDNPGVLNRFFLSYNFLSIKYNTRVNICLSTSELKPIISIISLFSSAC